jgi:transposase-like protein
MERRKFTLEYKLVAVRKVFDLGLSILEVARDLKVRESMIISWRMSFEADGNLVVNKSG